MSQVFVKFSGKLFLLVLLSFFINHPWAATCQSGDQGASTDRTEPPALRSDIEPPTTAGNTTDSKSKKGPLLLAEVEPLLLLLFGLFLFSVATGIKLKLSRAHRTSSQRFDPLVPRPARRSGTRS